MVQSTVKTPKQEIQTISSGVGATLNPQVNSKPQTLKGFSFNPDAFNRIQAPIFIFLFFIVITFAVISALRLFKG